MMRNKRTRSGLALALAGAMALTATVGAAAQDEETEVAYLSATSANTWLRASALEMESIAADNGIKITEFDGLFDPALQTTQLQDAMAAGRYDGIIVAAIDGAGLIPDLQAASEQGIKIVALNQIVGDQLDTADPQDASVSASVLAPPLRSGERLGAVTLQACEGKDPCNVVYMFGIKGIPLDIALRQGFDAVTEGSTVDVVAEGEVGYLSPDDGITAMADILVGTQDIDVVLGSDQGMQGVEIALMDAGVLDQVDIIGLGGSSPALAAIADGRWFGGVMGAPATEGRLAIEAMISALAGEDTGGFDPLLELPDEGLISADNVDSFTAEWDG
jgi:ribose transport system substrate-binding protein